MGHSSSLTISCSMMHWKEGYIAATSVVLFILPLAGYCFVAYVLQADCLVRDYCEIVHDGVATFFTSLTTCGIESEDDFARAYKHQLPSIKAA